MNLEEWISNKNDSRLLASGKALVGEDGQASDIGKTHLRVDYVHVHVHAHDYVHGGDSEKFRGKRLSSSAQGKFQGRLVEKSADQNSFKIRSHSSLKSFTRSRIDSTSPIVGVTKSS